uniref:Uncharacterized protein n=1 Tax=Romanomermis culicivorax TaxID=13658 RepID=A0A915KUI2_ROMCU
MQINDGRPVAQTNLHGDGVSIWKSKDDVTKCSNYRPIRLLCHAMKISERVLDAKLCQLV